MLLPFEPIFLVASTFIITLFVALSITFLAKSASTSSGQGARSVKSLVTLKEEVENEFNQYKVAVQQQEHELQKELQSSRRQLALLSSSTPSPSPSPSPSPAPSPSPLSMKLPLHTLQRPALDEVRLDTALTEMLKTEVFMTCPPEIYTAFTQAVRGVLPPSYGLTSPRTPGPSAEGSGRGDDVHLVCSKEVLQLVLSRKDWWRKENTQSRATWSTVNRTLMAIHDSDWQKGIEDEEQRHRALRHTIPEAQ